MRADAAEMARIAGGGTLLVEFGSGSSRKTRGLLAALERPAGYVAIDISGEHLGPAAETIRREHPGLPVAAIPADFTRSFELPAELTSNARRTIVYFPGSTIGNFVPEAACALLEAIAAFVGPAGGLLIGTDLVKAADVLEAAYDDARGVTAAFNLNLLTRINRELGGDFDLPGFRHVARYERALARIEMWLESARTQVVHVAGHAIAFSKGERILTEYSHKYTPDGFERLARTAGLALVRTWTDPEHRFAVQFLRPRASAS
jgi:dimethylhistidine N-methyltransferase